MKQIGHFFTTYKGETYISLNVFVLANICLIRGIMFFKEERSNIPGDRRPTIHDAMGVE
jgi:hypothetical protein